MQVIGLVSQKDLYKERRAVKQREEMNRKEDPRVKLDLSGVTVFVRLLCM